MREPIRMRTGPGMIRDENGRLSGYVYVDVSGQDIGSYVRDAKKAVTDKVKVPAGYELVWSGQYEFMERVAQRLKLVVPITLFIVFLLLYFNTGSAIKTMIILLAVPFSAIGANRPNRVSSSDSAFHCSSGRMVAYSDRTRRSAAISVEMRLPPICVRMETGSILDGLKTIA